MDTPQERLAAVEVKLQALTESQQRTGADVRALIARVDTATETAIEVLTKIKEEGMAGLVRDFMGQKRRRRSGAKETNSRPGENDRESVAPLRALEDAEQPQAERTADD